jgi:hypothetical protein
MSGTGAGGTEGGIAKFIVGLAMFIGGGYLLLNSIVVTNDFYWRSSLFHVGGFSLTSGVIMIPFMLGIGLVFYNYKNILGWILTLGSLLCLVLGVISSTHFVLRQMSAFELIVILVLLLGGAGLFLSSLRKQ